MTRRLMDWLIPRQASEWGRLTDSDKPIVNRDGTKEPPPAWTDYSRRG